MGCTGSWAFAAGVVIQEIKRYIISPAVDILLFYDKALSENDRQLLEGMGCTLLPFQDESAQMPKSVMDVFSPLSLTKFVCFDLLDFYKTVVWLDLDLVVQDDISPLFSFGPFSIAKEDSFFYENPEKASAAINGYDLPGLDPSRPNYNSGVLVFSNELPSYRSLHARCINYINAYAAHIRYPDQAAFNMLVQSMPDLVTELPTSYNAHPKNPESVFATIVHTHGAYKIWNDGLMLACFSEWQRDYARWLGMGGSAYTGPVENSSYAASSPFSVFAQFFTTLEKGNICIERLQKELEIKDQVIAKLTRLLEKK